MKLDSAKLVETEDLVAVAELAVMPAAASDESGSAAGDKHVVALHLRQKNADAMPVNPLTYDEIKALVEDAGGEMKVGDVELEAPVAVKKASTRAFVYKGTANVVVNYRYEF